eukprot:3673779-Prymnesium_polylepis.1
MRHDSQSHTCGPANILAHSISARCAATRCRFHAIGARFIGRRHSVDTLGSGSQKWLRFLVKRVMRDVNGSHLMKVGYRAIYF